jgi:hypothetical protein
VSAPEVTVLVPNYRTPQVTRLCLRLLRRHTDPARARVLVVDNGSADESLDYLRGLSWIRLVERRPVAGESVAKAHARALDLGLAEVDTPFVLSIHTDTFVRRDDWLEALLGHLRASEAIGGVGSWKLEPRPPLKNAAKQVERAVQSVVFPLIGRGYGKIEGLGENWYYLRSHCAMYRMEPIRRHHLRFDEGDDHTPAGKMMHRRLESLGYRMKFLTAGQLMRYIVHVNHATMVLNPDLGARRRTIVKGRQRLDAIFERLEADRILQDASLDA